MQPTWAVWKILPAYRAERVPDSSGNLRAMEGDNVLDPPSHGEPVRFTAPRVTGIQDIFSIMF